MEQTTTNETLQVTEEANDSKKIGVVGNSTKLSDEQVTAIYDELKDIDKESQDRLKAASEPIEDGTTDGIEEIDQNLLVPGVNMGDLKAYKKDYEDVLSQYNITDEEMLSVVDLISKYRKGEKIAYYNMLPDSLKQIADGFRLMGAKEGYKMGKNEAARFVLGEMVKDASFSNAVDQFQTELADTVNEMNSEYDRIFTEAFEEVFNKIDEIEEKDPERAQMLRRIKEAFDEAINLDGLKRFVSKKKNLRKLDAMVGRYFTETYYLNNLVNVTDVKIPDVGELSQIIYTILPEYGIKNTQRFVMAFCRYCSGVNVKDNIYDLAFVYRFVSTIHTYKFAQPNTETASLLFGNIAEVMNSIIDNL